MTLLAFFTMNQEKRSMVHLGNLPEDLRVRHAALAPLWLKPFGGFSKETHELNRT